MSTTTSISYTVVCSMHMHVQYAIMNTEYILRIFSKTNNDIYYVVQDTKRSCVYVFIVPDTRVPVARVCAVCGQFNGGAQTRKQTFLHVRYICRNYVVLGVVYTALQVGTLYSWRLHAFLVFAKENPPRSRSNAQKAHNFLHFGFQKAAKRTRNSVLCS
jgi:hypothetical protein